MEQKTPGEGGDFRDASCEKRTCKTGNGVRKPPPLPEGQRQGEKRLQLNIEFFYIISSHILCFDRFFTKPVILC